MTTRRTRRETNDDKDKEKDEDEDEEEEPEAEEAEERSGADAEPGTTEERPATVAESGGYVLEEGKEDQGWRLKNPPIAPETSTTTPPEEPATEPEVVIDNTLPEPEGEAQR